MPQKDSFMTDHHNHARQNSQVTATQPAPLDAATEHELASLRERLIAQQQQSLELREQLVLRELEEQLIAEMKERERILIELRTAQKLESVGRLAAGVAHEINTPIQYVGDSLYFLRDAVADISRLIDTCQTAINGLADDPATV